MKKGLEDTDPRNYFVIHKDDGSERSNGRTTLFSGNYQLDCVIVPNAFCVPSRRSIPCAAGMPGYIRNAAFESRKSSDQTCEAAIHQMAIPSKRTQGQPTGSTH